MYSGKRQSPPSEGWTHQHEVTRNVLCDAAGVGCGAATEQFRGPIVISPMNFFTIKDLENLSGIKAHTIRIWEQRYSFLKPKRSQTNIRYYESDELKTLLNIALINNYGISI